MFLIQKPLSYLIQRRHSSPNRRKTRFDSNDNDKSGPISDDGKRRHGNGNGSNKANLDKMTVEQRTAFLEQKRAIQRGRAHTNTLKKLLGEGQLHDALKLMDRLRVRSWAELHHYDILLNAVDFPDIDTLRKVSVYYWIFGRLAFYFFFC